MKSCKMMTSHFATLLVMVIMMVGGSRDVDGDGSGVLVVAVLLVLVVVVGSSSAYVGLNTLYDQSTTMMRLTL